jgi:phosphate transport system substrate-binding protein
MKKRFLILVAALMAMMVVTAPAFAVTKIVTGGSTGLQILGSALAAQYGKDSGGKYRVTVSGGGSGAGQTGASNGTFQIGNSSSDMSSSTPKGLTFTPITKEPFAIVVNKSNPVKGLTAAQVKCFSRVATSGTRQSFQKLFLGSISTPVSNSCPALASNALDRSAVANSKSGIAFVTYAYTVGSGGATVKTLPIDGVSPSLTNVVSNKYKFWNCQYFVTKGDPAGDVATYINWVRSAKGAAIIKAYAVPFTGTYDQCIAG